MMIGLIAVFVLYVVVAAVSGRIMTERLKGVTITGDIRLSFYVHGICESWIATLCLGVMSFFAGVRVLELGLRFPAANPFGLNMAFEIATGIVAVAVFAFMCYQYIGYRVSPDARHKAWEQLAGSANANAKPKDLTVDLLLPRDARQRHRFFFVALTAGVCEEFIFRGVAFALCHYLIPDMNIYLLPLIPGAIFGMAHIYQGMTGVLKTGVVGILLGYFYIATGSLIPVMILHFILDLSSCYIAPDQDEPDAAPKAD
jgi:membrane protease YdiL (CAAX protease family)